MQMPDTALSLFVKIAESHLGRWYIWGGDDPSGFDCSGLVVECLKTVGFLDERQDMTANDLWQSFQSYACGLPKRGALVFYFNGDDYATHVAICLDGDYCITADGGGSKIKSMADAVKHNAFVKVRPINKRIQHKRYVYLF